MTELVQWIAYFQLNPSGEMRADWRIGQLAALIGNMLGGKLKPSDFMLQPDAVADHKASRLSIEEASARSEKQCMGMALLAGARLVKRERGNGTQS